MHYTSDQCVKCAMPRSGVFVFFETLFWDAQNPTFREGHCSLAFKIILFHFFYFFLLFFINFFLIQKGETMPTYQYDICSHSVSDFIDCVRKHQPKYGEEGGPIQRWYVASLCHSVALSLPIAPLITYAWLVACTHTCMVIDMQLGKRPPTMIPINTSPSLFLHGSEFPLPYMGVL